ncbi:LOW QUALITY PROTEIN: DUF1162 domain-containing protein/Chorein_N domain-containing protein [Cephalotus follicularis]|uniref:DUF1162 domain-containing protein/Chorein_N domain-containing protein n=1 Tax=Cephalotus follicularis TaxID=3775 RepID=A0A1Q3BH95_CEPFO|nr:LOW QUALITY PROTEIN: DUF1162 domain-containing protein/Chorein_N domain-containing protein [Cephalotus follicularis]
MFEKVLQRLVKQLIVGYLRRYVKNVDIKVTYSTEFLLLDNVELILEAFDYLQLPFAFNQARIGRLSIKFPWKSLGRQPFVVCLEDVYVCVSQRGDQEWSLDEVQRREFAAKSAKLAAAELSKLSRPAGANLYDFYYYPVIYIIVNTMSYKYGLKCLLLLIIFQAQVMFGLRFSSLTISNQNLVRSSSGRVSGGQANKDVKIKALEVYCCKSKEGDLISLDFATNNLLRVDVSMSLSVNRLGMVDDDLPQYSISAEITSLIMSLNEVQLQEILILSDYLCTNRLREKYGRYRPCGSPLFRKLNGWQKLWWRYAQESILSDVRKKLKKTSWRYLGQRLCDRRKYVNLYKNKLEFLRQGQSIDSFIGELEQMEKEFDIEDILSYRSIAEHELQEVLSNTAPVSVGGDEADSSVEKSQISESSSGRSRGWLNWLSCMLGAGGTDDSSQISGVVSDDCMLGAGGTDDSSQFSGVVSDEVIKDIYEETKFHPLVLSRGGPDARDKICTCSIQFSIIQISATLWTLSAGQEIAKLILNGAVIEFKLWEALTTIFTFIKSVDVLHPSNEKVILRMRGVDEPTSCTVQVDVSPNQEIEYSFKVILQSPAVVYDAEFFIELEEFFAVLGSFQFQHKRVLSSLDGIENVKARLLSKAECILSSHKKMIWNARINNIIVNVPLQNLISDHPSMVLEWGSVQITSKCDSESLASSIEEQSYDLNSISTFDLSCFSPQNLYNHFEVKLNDFEIKLLIPHHPESISIFEKFCASFSVASFIIPDETILKQLEVHIIVMSLHAHLSPPIFESFVELILHLDNLHARSEPVTMNNNGPCNIMTNRPRAPAFGVSITANLESVIFHVDLGNEGENSTALKLALRELDIRYSFTGFEECWICMKALEIVTYPLGAERDSHILFSSSSVVHQEDMGVELTDQSDNYNDRNLSVDACFLLHYEAHRSVASVCQKYTVFLNDADIHCYPHVFGLLIGFYDRVSSYVTCAGENSVSSSVDAKNPKKMPHFGFQRFGFSNFFQTGSPDNASISLDQYPFVTIYNSGFLGTLESSLLYTIPEWRKLFNVRDRKLRSPKCSLKKRLKKFHCLPLKSTSVMDACPVVGSSDDTNSFVVDMDLCGIRVHFHDSSCIIGTITLPTIKSSLTLYEDCMDLLCSAEGLILTTSWCTTNFSEFLWGPSLPNLSPFLNVRIRKGNIGLLSSQLEVSIGIQHVCCVLPPEYLSIIIGYFSLPDWSSKTSVQLLTENIGGIDIQNEITIVYKFEVLDSNLILPVESNDYQFLKVGIQQMYCSFIPDCALSNILKDIPPAYIIHADKIAKRSHCLNLFGRNLFVSLLSYKDDGYGCLKIDQETGSGNTTLIAPLSADVWVRLPCESESSSSATCIMSRIGICQLSVDDGYRVDGFETLVDVINQLSSVGDESKSFTSVLQFIQYKKYLKGKAAISPASSGMIFTEVGCFVDSLLITLHNSRNDSVLSEPVAKFDMQFKFSVSLIDEAPKSLNLSFSSLTLHSLLNPVMLARCSGFCSTSSVLDICHSTSVRGENEIHVSLPALVIWLHIVDWSEIIDFFSSCARRLSNAVPMGSPSKDSTMGMVDSIENAEATVSLSSVQNFSGSTVCESENMKLDTVYIVKSENIGISINIPISVSEKAFSKVGDMPQNVSSIIYGGNHCDFVAVSMQSTSSELIITGKNVKLKSILEKTSGTAGMYEDNGVSNWPLFQITQVNVETEINGNKMEVVHVNVGIEFDRLDVWLSHRAFYFWHNVRLDISNPGHPRFAFGNLDFTIQLKKISLLISDGRWSCSGPLFEILLRNLLLQANATEDSLKSEVFCDLQVNYNNNHKVCWEPFVEPWKFQMHLIRKHETTAVLNNSAITNIHLISTAQLKLNITESFFECFSRTMEMINDAWGSFRSDNIPETQRFLNLQFTDNICGGRYAPYILQNLTSLPLVYHVYQGMVSSDGLELSEMEDGKTVEPGASIPIYLDTSPEEQLFRCRPARSFDILNEKQSNCVLHHLMTIQLAGMSMPSAPISMDLVGLSYFEVDFSNEASRIRTEEIQDSLNYNTSMEENNRVDDNNCFLVPVVLDVSLQRYSKLIRLYSTVVFLNATLMPLELRFDSPFGLSPKILDPVYPGQEFPLPIHLAEAGCMRWRPLANSYLWSGAHTVSDILSQKSKSGFLKSFVCYPYNPNTDSFRCCISVESISLASSDRPKKGTSVHVKSGLRQPVVNCDQILHDLDVSRKRVLHRVTFKSPLAVNNYLPEVVSVTIESGGITRTALLSEVETSFYYIDPSHDLELEFNMHGFRPSVLKFPRTEKFSTMAKFSGTKYSLSETLIFYPDSYNGPVYVTVEKMVDAFSGARELFIFVPFLLYNCTAFPLSILDSDNEMKGSICTIPSCYDLLEKEPPEDKKIGLSLLSCNQNSITRDSQIDATFNFLKGSLCSSSLLTVRDTDFMDNERGKVKACMYSPHPISPPSETTVRLSRYLPEYFTEKGQDYSWSEPFNLLLESGSVDVLIHEPSTNAAYIVSVTSIALAGPFAGRTRAITFQPSKELFYKQKGTDAVFHLGVGQNAHLHCTDRSRNLLVSVRFNEPGCQWSGSFLPDQLGDTQVKVRNYVSGGLNMIRVEVRNADVSIRNEEFFGSFQGNSGTNLILLSDDDTGYMAYRIDNFSTERLRIYQQSCETFGTIVLPYTFCPYAWDEPSYPHCLTVEVPGECVVGSYAIDDLKEFVSVDLRSTSEKPERTLLLSVRAEGATKVLSIIDSRYHNWKDTKDQSTLWFQERGKQNQKDEDFVKYLEKFSLTIPYISISLIDSHPQELLFACAKNVKVDLLQSLAQQKLFFQISSLQIDNQLRTTPYPVILSFNHEYRSNLPSQRTKKDSKESKSEKLLQITSDNFYDPVLHLAVSKWRKNDVSIVSFEYISLRVADFRLELDQQVILGLLDYFRSVSPLFQSQVLPFTDPTLLPLIYDVDFVMGSSIDGQTYEGVTAREDHLHRVNIPAFSGSHRSISLPSIVPVGAPWQKIYLLARRQKKIYVELLDLSPIKFTLSFSSAPWMLKTGVLTSGASLIHRHFMALADVEGARICLKQLTIANHMARWESIYKALIIHYTSELRRDMYKVIGSAGVIGNPVGFARSVGLGIRDFLSVPSRGVSKSPTGLITGMAQGTFSLLSNTVYALSDTATQFSKAAHKGIVAFTLDDQAVARMKSKQKGVPSHSEGLISEVFEGLTGLLQAPIKEAEKHGLPGVVSGIALGVTGLVARPAASILELVGKTAQSVRNRNKLYYMRSERYRLCLPRPLSRELPLRPYSWEEAIGTSVLMDSDDGLKFKDDVLVMCKALKQASKFVVITGRILLVVSCPGLVDFGKPEFRGVALDPKWVVESEISLDSVIYAYANEWVVRIVGNMSNALSKHNHGHSKKGSGTKTKSWNNLSAPFPLFMTTLELTSKDDAAGLLEILLSRIEQGGWGSRNLLHQRVSLSSAFSKEM